MFVLKNWLRNLPCGSNFSLNRIKWDNFLYLDFSSAGDVLNSFPQCGRASNGANSFSINGNSILTAGQSCFQLKWMFTQGCSLQGLNHKLSAQLWRISESINI